MKGQEKAFYHQVHPAKLLSDQAACALAVFAFWTDRPVPGVIAAVAIPAVASFFVMRHADLERCRRSRLGAYAKKYLTRSADARRLFGYALMGVGAWQRSLTLVLIGASIVIHAWTAGLLVPKQAART